MPRILMNEDRCRGCGICLEVCPKGAIAAATSLNRDGFHPAKLENAEACTGCTMCALMCPHLAIVKVFR